MDPISQCRPYFEAWNRHDADAIAHAFAPDGSYRDPTTPGPLRGDALRGYAQGLWSAFPDLAFELGPQYRLDERRVFAAWTMTGTNTGSMNGLPPTGRRVRVEGIDVIETAADGLASVVGWFDPGAVPRQLGLQVIVQPAEIGPFSFGIGSTVRTGRPAEPACIGFTELVARSDADVQQIRDMSRQTIVELLEAPGFLSFTSAVDSRRRMVTVSAWDSVDAMRAAMSRGTHAQAMRAFFDGGIAEGGTTSVWQPLRVGPYWRRCDACGRMARLAERQGRCGCGRALQAVT